uniref:Regulator of rDNA transcription protein 15 n=1 Tax=Heterorhabditis bacteriophora TaxID=37862 RepID=A0A1I7WDK2_HETBA
MDAWLPQASYPCGNFSDTSYQKLSGLKGSIGHAFAVCTRTESQDQASFCPFALREVSVLSELALGHLRYDLTDVPPQSNSPPDIVFDGSRNKKEPMAQSSHYRISKESMKVVVFHWRH